MTNVVSLAAVRAQRGAVSIPFSHAELSEKIDVVAHQYLSPAAVLLLRQIVRFTREGKSDLSYTFLCNELQISRRSLPKYLEELELHCFIKVRRSRVSKLNDTNQFEIDFKGPLGVSMPALKVPRYTRVGGRAKNALVGQKLPCNNISKEEEKIPNRNQRVSAPQFNSISDAIEHASKRVVRKREEKVAKATRPGAMLTLAGVKATWSASMLKHYPKVPPVFFTLKEFAVFKMRMAPILITCNMSEFFDFVVSSWKSLREIKFKWLRAKGKDVAVSPSLPELMRYWKIFAQAFSDSRMAEAVNKDKLKRTEVQELQNKLAEQSAEAARAKAEAADLRQKLARAEKLTSSPIQNKKPELSLSERRRLAEAKYNDGEYEIPDWK
jgi:hypothetical protein